MNRANPAVSGLLFVLFLLAGAFLPGCGPAPVTELVVVVTTDLGVPDQIDQIRIDTLRADSDVVDRFDFGIYAVDASSMPLTIGVLVPDALLGPMGELSPDEPTRVAIQVDATGPMDRDRVTTTVEAEFRAGQSLEVPIFVAERCRRVMCPRSWSCGGDGCVPIADLTPPEMQWDGDPEMLTTIPPTPPEE
ncbi:MAG: hypothetical protein AB7S26_38630 [Sandaracinaceae bacterium]